MTIDSKPRQLRSTLFHALRAGFRALPIREATRDALRSRFFERFPSIRPIPPQGQISPVIERRARMHAGGRAIGYVERRDEPLPDPLPATLVAFYLPQFHSIPENDEWWGKGFTEWHNVARALPQFEGHAQPRLPSDLGFYDLRNPQVMRDQAALAQAYGISAFCMYFYWFGGRTLLEAPVQQCLEDESITLPICLCWANESWTRRWDGHGDEILVEQRHSPEDDLAFIARVARYMREPRYLRIDGKPLLLVYRPGLLPDARATAERWRTWCLENGIGEITLAYVQGFERPDPRKIGFDAAVEFPPNLSTPANITARQRLLNPDYSGEVLDWREVARDYSQRPMPDYRLFPGVNCGWDNEPRRPAQGRTYLHASPRAYRDWICQILTTRLSSKPASDRLVFVNAWNEWAESAVLEPDCRLGHAWLQATRSALQLVSCPPTPTPVITSLYALVHAWYPDTFEEILASLQACGLPLRLIVTTAPEKAAQIRAALDRHSLQADVEVLENRGRDILPFLRVANRLVDEGVEVVLKLHTKRSPHRSDGNRWRRELLDRLLSPERAPRVLQAFARDPTLGMVAPDGHVQPLSYYWGANKDNVRYLATRIGIAAPEADLDTFVSGSMFWLRLNALRPLLDAHLGDCEFEAETAQLDGSFAHAIERIFGLCVHDQGLRIEHAAAVCGEPDPPMPASYPYARRD